MTDSTVSAARRRSLIPVVIAGGVVGWGLMVAMVVTQQPFSLVGMAALAVFGACWIGGRFLTRDLAERRANQVDEYEFDQRSEVRDAGYVVALGVMMVSFVLLTVAMKLAENGVPGLLHQAPYIVFVGFLLAAAAPTFLLAWRVRNQTDEEGEV
ncbi:MAG: hypothetical protein ACTH2Q_00695 [Propionibacteriaceae bacterium]